MYFHFLIKLANFQLPFSDDFREKFVFLAK